MDPISQAALGATLSTSTAPREETVLALALGAVAGMAADLDVLIRSPTDPLMAIEYHRHFTHALAFAPLGALVCALALYPLVRRKLEFRRAYLYCLLGFATHGLLDACTSWGTALLWPFSEARTAWNLVAVVDPLFTLPLLGALAFAAALKRPRLAGLALAWTALYLSTGVVQRERAEAAALDLAERRGHAQERLTVKPTFGNLLVWKTVYEANGAFHVDAVRLGAQAAHFPGASVPRLDVARDLPWLVAGSRLAADVERFSRFSDGYVSLAGDGTEVVDIRYSMVPNRIEPLWGIGLDPRASSDSHAEFIVRREMTPAHREDLIELFTAPGS